MLIVFYYTFTLMHAINRLHNYRYLVLARGIILARENANIVKGNISKL